MDHYLAKSGIIKDMQHETWYETLLLTESLIKLKVLLKISWYVKDIQL